MAEKPALFTFDDLLVHADGKISAVFGKEFCVPDDRPIRIRMPSPPLLLLDRIVDLNSKPGGFTSSNDRALSRDTPQRRSSSSSFLA
jgi:hypothetical protein